MIGIPLRLGPGYKDRPSGVRVELGRVGSIRAGEGLGMYWDSIFLL